MMKFLNKILWSAAVILVVMLAMYVSVGRLLVSNIAGFRTQILQELNARLPFVIEAEAVRGEWQSFTPSLVLSELRITLPRSDSSPLQLAQGRIRVDVLNSLRTRSLRVTRLELDNLTLRGELSSSGALHFSGFDESPGTASAALREFLLTVESVALRQNRLTLTLPGGEVRDLDLNLSLERDGSRRRVDATLTSTRGTHITVLAEGMGDPFLEESFSGQLYIKAEADDLGAVQDMLTEQPLPAWAEGAASLELWLQQQQGEVTVEARAQAHDLVVAAADSSWELPLDRVAVQARLLEDAAGWTLFLSDLEVIQRASVMRVPRAQLDVGENSLRLRARDVPLAPLNALFTQLAAVAEPVRSAFAALDPRGNLAALQLQVGDLGSPVDHWQLDASFEELAVESLAGAPGATAGAGYTRVQPGRALVILDSRDMTLGFPTVYEEPLHFEDLHGSLYLEWDDDALQLRSGLLSTLGQEGPGKVLLRLQIPLVASAVGVEMDLLVGLQDLHPGNRQKFIPQVLDPALRAWLDDSIGDGQIDEGAFIWRGSLRADAEPLRTVQLAFNVVDTQLTYHPQWPPVLVNKGVILISDSDVSVWAERAQLYDSSVANLSVETRLNAQAQITLALAGRINGPVADGFRVLRESPLSSVVGSAFADWTVSGDLETQLALRLNLGDPAIAPVVDVATQWHNASLLIAPGQIPLEAVQGDFTYSTSSGFSSNALVGKLWGKPVAAQVVQQHAAADGYDPARSTVEVQVAGAVAMPDVWRWLQLQPLPFVTGQTDVAVSVRLAPQATPRLTISSDLKNIELDLPEPWGKRASESQVFRLDAQLQQGVMPVSLALGEQLKANLNIVAGSVRGASLGIDAEPGQVTDGELLIAGHTPLLQLDQWLAFVTQYWGPAIYDVAAGSPPAQAAPAEASPTPGAAAPVPAANAHASQMTVRIDQLQADTVVVMQQRLQDVVLDLALEPALWALSVQSDWLRAGLSMVPGGGRAQLQLDYLDLDRLPELVATGKDSAVTPDFPAVAVGVRNLYQSQQRLGELDFTVSSRAGVVAAQQISGELAGLRLSPGQPGQLIWKQGEADSTQLQATVQFEDLGQSLEYFGYQRILETDNGAFDIDVSWPGAPQDFSLTDGSGAMRVAIGHGSFLEAPATATGALRVVSILNLADIVQRLSLSTMFESGIPFDSVDGQVNLRDGALQVTRMDVEGSSSFRFTGVSEVAAQSLKGELVATLPVANNLPWIVALAANLPVAAGVYVVSRLFGTQMNRLSSAVYAISGSWNDPQVSFDRIFDNTTHPAPEDTTDKVQSSSP